MARAPRGPLTSRPNKDWEGIVYPSPRPRDFDPLTYLAGYFDTVEVNSTFYRPCAPSAAQAWADRAEAGERAKDRFRFTAKLWQRFTHRRDGAFTAADVDAVRRGFDVLAGAGRLGAVLVQFPWSFKRDDANREWLDDVTRAFGTGGYVRPHGRNYDDWFRPDAGVEARYDYLYSAEELAPWAERTKAVAAAAPETYAVTNSHYRGQAITNAVTLEAMVAGERVDAPPGVRAEYGTALERYVRA